MVYHVIEFLFCPKLMTFELESCTY